MWVGAGLLALVAFLLVYVIEQRTTAREIAVVASGHGGPPVPGADYNTPEPGSVDSDPSASSELLAPRATEIAEYERAYPAPPSATYEVPSPGVYETMSAEEVAEAISGEWAESGYGGDDLGVIAFADVTSEHAEALLVPERLIDNYGSPDVVVVLEGEFPIPTGRVQVDGPAPYTRILIDRTTGLIYSRNMNDDVVYLLESLPEGYGTPAE
jgi:hypothetical protein